jgi:hypothetical protein
MIAKLMDKIRPQAFMAVLILGGIAALVKDIIQTDK